MILQSLTQLCFDLSGDPDVQARKQIIPLCNTLLKRLNEVSVTQQILPTIQDRISQRDEVAKACTRILLRNTKDITASYLTDQNWLSDSSLLNCQEVTRDRFPYRLLGLDCMLGFLSCAALHVRCATVCNPLPRLFCRKGEVGSELKQIQKVFYNSTFPWLRQCIRYVQAGDDNLFSQTNLLSQITDNELLLIQWLLQCVPAGLELVVAPGIRNPNLSEDCFIDSLPRGDPFCPSLEFHVDYPIRPTFKQLRKRYGSTSK